MSDKTQKVTSIKKQPITQNTGDFNMNYHQESFRLLSFTMRQQSKELNTILASQIRLSQHAFKQFADELSLKRKNAEMIAQEILRLVKPFI